MLYLIMAVVGLATAWHAVAHAERKAELASMAAFAVAVVLMADWVAFGWLRLYTYTPGLLADPMKDARLGQLLADVVFVPCLTIILNVYLLGVAGIAVGTVLVTAIEILFVRLNLFQQHGWAYWMTFFGFPVFYCATCEFYRASLNQGIFPGWIRLITRLSLVFNTLGLVRLLLAALQWEWVSLHILPIPIGNQALGRFIVYGLLSVPPGLWVISSDRTGRLFRLGVVTALFLTMNLGLETLRFHLYRPPWNSTFDALARGAAILVACLVDDWIVRQAGAREPRRAI